MSRKNKRCCYLQQCHPLHLVPTGLASWRTTAVIHRAALPGPTVIGKASLLCFVTLLNGKQFTQELAEGKQNLRIYPLLPSYIMFSSGERRFLHSTYFSNFGWSRRCKRSLTTDFCNNVFSLLFPTPNKVIEQSDISAKPPPRKREIHCFQYPWLKCPPGLQ